MANMKEEMITALLSHAKGHIYKHRVNILNILEKPVGVAEHPDIMETIEKELKIMAEYEDQVDIINKYFKVNP